MKTESDQFSVCSLVRVIAVFEIDVAELTFGYFLLAICLLGLTTAQFSDGSKQKIELIYQILTSLPFPVNKCTLA